MEEEEQEEEEEEKEEVAESFVLSDIKVKSSAVIEGQ
jgi:hypothetical protein